MTTPPSTREAAAINAVARETLRRIAQERISPTPDSYDRIYREIAATHPDHPRMPPRDDGVQARTLATTLARLTTQIEAHHAGITVTRKREGLKRALVPRLETPDSLRARLDRLMDSWNGPNAEIGANVSQFLGTDIFGHDADLAEPPAPERLSMSHSLSVSPHVHASLRSPAHDTTLGTGDLPDRVISVRMAGLLALILKNIEELTPESALLSNQIEQVGRVLTMPLTEKKLDEAERCLRALIVRQGAMKHALDETKRSVRDLASSLLERLSTLVSSTDSYSTKIVDMSQRIADADDLGQLSHLTQLLVSDTRLMSANIAAEREMLLQAQARTEALQQRTNELEVELREASALVRTDPLTHALNRRGFGDAYAKEMERARAGVPPSIALLDVDNFKNINEAHGHAIGDEVLCRLVEVLHRCARSTDTVARYGGEEFALIFPEQTAAQAEHTITAMQGALRDHIATDRSRPVITFSAGIAQVVSNESLADAMTRADRALRRAKQAGKDRIVVAAPADARPAYAA